MDRERNIMNMIGTSFCNKMEIGESGRGGKCEYEYVGSKRVHHHLAFTESPEQASSS